MLAEQSYPFHTAKNKSLTYTGLQNVHISRQELLSRFISSEIFSFNNLVLGLCFYKPTRNSYTEEMMEVVMQGKHNSFANGPTKVHIKRCVHYNAQ